MARFHTVPRCPLTVQFWLLGLDARQGDLGRRGFVRTPAPRGSSVHTLGPLALHSAGLTLDLAGGQRPGREQLRCERRLRLFTLGGAFLPAREGLALCRPFLLEHEAWVTRTHGPEHRARQLRGHRLPPPVRRNVPTWEAYLGAGEALDAHLWTVERAHSAGVLRLPA